LTDAVLIRRAREETPQAPGERRRAWSMLCERYLPLVWRYAYALLKNTHVAEDVASEVMLAFLKNIEKIDAEAPKISAWLRSVVRHKVADHHRQVYRAKKHLPRVALEHPYKNADQRQENPQDPATPLLVAEKKIEIAEILEGLPERQRLALEWKYVEGMRVRDIATRLGETEKAVEATLYRARRDFRHEFSRRYEIEHGETQVQYYG